MIVAITFIPGMDPTVSDTVPGMLNLDNVTHCWDQGNGVMRVDFVNGKFTYVRKEDLDRAIAAMPVGAF